MSIFNTILEKLGIEKKSEAPAAPAPAAPKPAAPAPMPSAPQQRMMAPGSMPPPPAGVVPPAPAPMAMVDVVSKLDGLAKKSPIQLDWKVSIVDLLVLLGIDHSAATIQELAVELGCPASEMSDSARRNIWLHQAVMQKIAQNGGNIPAYLIKK